VSEAHWVPALNDLVTRGPATSRPAVLDILRAAGVEIRGLTTEDGRLDAFYRELIEEHR
jgi:hypothetical protein